MDLGGPNHVGNFCDAPYLYDTKNKKLIESNICGHLWHFSHFIEKGADMVLCTGGMSVDPDDKTPKAIKDTGAEIISYGAPVLPGAMLLLSYYKKNDKLIPIIGLPGCVMYSKRTIFDLILPRVMADEKISKDDLSRLGLGGLCLNCEVCHYPNCGFGKGM